MCHNKNGKWEISFPEIHISMVVVIYAFLKAIGTFLMYTESENFNLVSFQLLIHYNLASFV